MCCAFVDISVWGDNVVRTSNSSNSVVVRSKTPPTIHNWELLQCRFMLLVCCATGVETLVRTSSSLSRTAGKYSDDVAFVVNIFTCWRESDIAT